MYGSRDAVNSAMPTRRPGDSTLIVPVVMLVVVVALGFISDFVATAPSSAAAAAAPPPAPTAAPAPRASARHRAHQPVEHARNLVAAIREVVVIDLVLQVTAEDQHVPKRLER